MDTRVARYSQEHDLTLSGRFLGHNDHLTVDPKAIVAIQEWKRARLDYQEAPAVSPTAAYARPLHLDRSGASARTVILAGVHGRAPQHGDEEKTLPASVTVVAAGEAGE
jgi:hypothetical protein